MRTAIVGVCGFILALSAISAQQPTPPAAGGRGQAATAPPPIDWPSPPLPAGPLSIDTALVRPIKLTIVTQWNLVPALEESTFVATPPDGAQKVAFAAQLPRVSPAASKPSGGKGVKR